MWLILVVATECLKYAIKILFLSLIWNKCTKPHNALRLELTRTDYFKCHSKYLTSRFTQSHSLSSRHFIWALQNRHHFRLIPIKSELRQNAHLLKKETDCNWNRNQLRLQWWFVLSNWNRVRMKNKTEAIEMWTLDVYKCLYL